MDSTGTAEVRSAVPLDLADVLNLDCGLTQSFLMCLRDAATVCFDERGHAPGVAMQVLGSKPAEYAVFWYEVDDAMKRTWADRDYATEHSAYCIAFLLVHDLKGMISIERSKKENGFDYWIGVKDHRYSLFQKKARLEVSGIRTGQENSVATRLDEKVTRLKKYKNPLSAIVIIVEFGTPQARITEIHGSRY